MIGIKVKTDGKYAYVTMNYRHIVENDWLDDLKYLCEPTRLHKRRYTVKFVCNRQVSHEFVRHRVFSFAQESTRYCNYTKGKFNGELIFIKPCWGEFGETKNVSSESWSNECAVMSYFMEVENLYRKLIHNCWQPQQAATILPNALKTELIMTGFEEDWCHFFALRALGTTGAPHPQAKELAEPLMKEFSKRGYVDETKIE